jgi:hypothetical protein
MRINKVIPTQDDKIYDHSINKRNYIHTFCQKKGGDLESEGTGGEK